VAESFHKRIDSGLLAGIVLEGLEQQHPARTSTLWIPVVYQAAGGLDKEKKRILKPQLPSGRIRIDTQPKQ
jgi:hypothetical protein